MKEKPKSDIFQSVIYKDGNLDALREQLTVIELANRLFNGCCMVGALWKKGSTKRRKENILNRSIINLDFDGGLSIEDFWRIAEANKVSPAILHSSSSHLKDGKTEKFRAIWVTDRPMNEDEFKYNTDFLAKKFGGYEEYTLTPTGEYTAKGNPKRKKLTIKEGIDKASRRINQIMYGHCRPDKERLVGRVEKDSIWKVRKYPESKRRTKEKAIAKILEENNRVLSKPGAEDAFYSYPLHRAFLDGDTEIFGATGSGTYYFYEEVANNFQAMGKWPEFEKGLEQYERGIGTFISISESTRQLSQDLIKHVDEETKTLGEVNRKKITTEKGIIDLEQLLVVASEERSNLAEMQNNYFYNEATRRWEVLSPSKLEYLIGNYFKNNYDATLNNHQIQNIVGMYMREDAAKLVEEEGLQEKKIGEFVIGLDDGTLAVDTNDKKLAFTPEDLTREYNCVLTLPVSYRDIQESKESYFRETITAMFDKENLNIVQMYLGACLLPQLETHIVLCMIGRHGREGKGSIFEAIQSLFAGNVSALNIGEWGLPHAKTAFVGSILNISQEVTGDQLDGELFKSVTGGDALTINPKNKPSFIYKPMMKHLLSLNKDVKVRGMDNAFVERMRVVEVRPRRKATDYQHKKKLKASKAAIMNFMIEGLKKFVENGLQFPAMKAESKERLINENSAVNEIFNDNLIPNSGDPIKLLFLQNAINDKLSEAGEPTLSQKKLRERLEIWCRMKGINFRITKPNNVYHIQGLRVSFNSKSEGLLKRIK